MTQRNRQSDYRATHFSSVLVFSMELLVFAILFIGFVVLDDNTFLSQSCGCDNMAVLGPCFELVVETHVSRLGSERLKWTDPGHGITLLA